jgi:MtrB/PioB family decaheme-associated outer membrane protein
MLMMPGKEWKSLLQPYRLLIAASYLLPIASLGQDTIEIGAGYVSEDSFKLGEYNGLNESQDFAVSSFSTGRKDAYNADTARYWQINGLNLGLDTRRLEAEVGYRGIYGIKVTWQEIPHYRFNNPVNTPFLGAGSARQTLPAGWTGASSTADLTALQPSLRNISIKTDRERMTAELDWQLDTAWSFAGEYRHESKKGNDTLGAIFGSNGGNPRGAILAIPVDYETDTFNLSLSRQGDSGQGSLFYRASLFNNGNRSVQWDNPFNNTRWTAGAGFDEGAVGEMAQAPDNSFWQAGASGVYRLGDSGRFNGSLSFGRMTQDENLLPYSNVFSDTSPLPVTSLAGEVNTLNAMLGFSTRFGQRSSLRLRYSFDERDNDTRVHLFLRVPGDAAIQGNPLSSNGRLNRPYSFRNQRLESNVDYRLSAATRLSFAYELRDRERDKVDVERTREHTASIKLSLSDFLNGRAWVQASRSVRDGSAYISNRGFLSGHNPDFINTLAGNELFENDPLLRRFHLADRERDQLSLNYNMAPAGAFSLDIIGRLTRDEFPDSKIGVQESANRHLTLNLNFDPGDWHGYAYVTAERYRNRQQGYSRRGGGNPTPFFPESVRLPGNNWQMATEDRVLTTGVGASWALLQERLDLTLDINRSRAATETSPFSSGLAWADFTDIDSTLTGISAKGQYRLENGHQVGLRYRFEKYDSSDFAFDNVAVDTLSNVILLGNVSPVYSGHIIEISFQYNLGGE